MAGYYPRTDGEKSTFLEHFNATLTVVAPTIGIELADMTAVDAAVDAFNAALADKVAKRTAAQSSTAAFAVTDKATEETIRGTVKRIKARPNYTAAIGEQLGIEAPESEPTGGTAGDRPNLEATGVLNGQVEISFLKVNHTGVEIRTKRGAETEYSFLARDTDAPYVDTRANLTPGPETRYYVGQFLQRDTLVGELSDVLVVTVPGVA